MASPPYNHSSFSAISPPYPSNTPLPQPIKRRQSDMPSGPANKRRKASMLSTTSASSHPLRQTSFPPEVFSTTPAYSRSPSVDTMSLVSGVSGAKKKRARKSKGKDDDSVVGGPSKSVVSAASAGSRARGKKRKAGEESEEEEDTSKGVDLQGARSTQEERQQEAQQRAMLTNAMSRDQFDRYEAWRMAKLADAPVRRIINQTLSQSVNLNIVIGVKAAAKIYAGEIIEGARKVQAQWDKQDRDSKEIIRGKMTNAGLTPPPEDEYIPGPLLPEHLIESYRRHKVAKEGAMTGHLGLWQLQNSSGIERFGLKTGGKRLFK